MSDVPLCGITTPHNHSSFDDPLACAWRDQVTVLTGDQVERTATEKRASHRYNDYPVTPFYDVVRCSCGWRGTPHSKIMAGSMWREAHLHVRRGAENNTPPVEKRPVELTCRHLKLVAAPSLQSWLGEAAWCDICRDYRDVVIER